MTIDLVTRVSISLNFHSTFLFNVFDSKNQAIVGYIKQFKSATRPFTWSILIFRLNNIHQWHVLKLVNLSLSFPTATHIIKTRNIINSKDKCYILEIEVHFHVIPQSNELSVIQSDKINSPTRIHLRGQWLKSHSSSNKKSYHNWGWGIS